LRKSGQLSTLFGLLIGKSGYVLIAC